MNGIKYWPAILSLLASLTLADATSQVLAPGYGALEYLPPAPGTYALPPLGKAGDGKVLNSQGKPMQLHEVLGDKLVLLGFIYTHCSDINGCPLASFVMKKVQNQLLQDKALASRVRLISLSFDPAQDTPEALVDYSRHFKRDDFDWQFLTTASETDLQPILEAYNQWRQKTYAADGSESGSFSHILRVFLIDKQRRIRNIYSTGFLHADTVVNDLRTLALE
ncbi:MAG: SCO family protein [Proteobacteria bacterium]|nr:SCO family protein [Pseudomonadota bacterium]